MTGGFIYCPPPRALGREVMARVRGMTSQPSAQISVLYLNLQLLFTYLGAMLGLTEYLKVQITAHVTSHSLVTVIIYYQVSHYGGVTCRDNTSVTL